jgi:hypothetical protein
VVWSRAAPAGRIGAEAREEEMDAAQQTHLRGELGVWRAMLRVAEGELRLAFYLRDRDAVRHLSAEVLRLRQHVDSLRWALRPASATG